MRSRYVLIAVVLVILAFGVERLSAATGTTDSPAAPGATNSYTLQDIYNRLDTGAAGAQSTFTEPAAGPGTGTMHDLNEIMAKSPAKDDTSGATTVDVAAGKKFWGLTGGQWGLQTGNLATQTVDNSTVNQAAGYYNAFDLSAVDTDLASGNIRSTVSIYGVAGNSNVVNTSSGDAAAGDILQGKKAWVDGSEVTGNVAAGNNVNGPDGSKTFNIPDGLYSGKTATANDSDLVAGNIKQGANIFGVTGSVIQATGNAAAGDVLTGKTFSNASAAGVNGTMSNHGAVTIVPTTTNQTIAEGYHNGSGKVEGDADLVAGNIKCGVTIFGVTGSILQYVAKTGQTSCWDSPGGSISCTGTGQDGEYRNGGLPVVAPSPGSSFGGYNRTSFTCSGGFTDNGNGTVTDNLTGLIWLQDATCSDLAGTDADGKGAWATALSAANSLASGTCGLSDGSSAGDWRLPNINELRSLFDPGRPEPYLPAGHPFTGVQSYYYWSSTTEASSTDLAWGVYLVSGDVSLGSKTFTSYVWPVRGGQ